MLQTVINDTFKSSVSGKVFRVVCESSHAERPCQDCAFEFNSKECFSNNRPSCHAGARNDGNYVIFKR